MNSSHFCMTYLLRSFNDGLIELLVVTWKYKVISQYGWIRHPCLYSPLNNSNLASIHGQRCLYRSCGIQHLLAMNPERISPTHALSNSVLTIGPAVDGKPALTPLGHSLEAPGEHYLKQPPQIWEPLWKSKFSVKRFWHNVGGNKDEFSHMGEGKRHNFGLPTLYLSLDSTAQCQETLFVHDFSWEGKWECVSVSSFPSCVGCFQRGSFISHTIQSTE